MQASPTHISFDDLLRDPSFMLLSYDFNIGQAQFYKVDRKLPNDHCMNAQQFPRIDVPFKMLLNQPHLYDQPTEKPVHFIWMTDFCASTLYAKSLNEVKGLYLYNETMVYADLAIEKRAIDHGKSLISLSDWQKLLKIALRFQSRTFIKNDKALVKEWPISNYILPEILKVDDRSHGIFLYATLDEYLVQTLKVPERREQARNRVTLSFTDINKMLPFKNLDFNELSDAQVIASHWMYLMFLHSENNLKDFPRLKTLHNRQFLLETTQTIQRSAKLFGGSTNKASAKQIANGPVFKTHSKESDKSFNIKKHESALAKHRDVFKKEISEGLEWSRVIMSTHSLPTKPAIDLFEVC